METQQEVYARFGVSANRPGAGEKLGIALSTIGALPINGLRIHLEGTCGWFIWLTGRRRSIPDFISRFMSSTVLNTCHRSNPICHCARIQISDRRWARGRLVRSDSYRQNELALGRTLLFVTVRDFSVLETCYAELNGRLRPEAVIASFLCQSYK